MRLVNCLKTGNLNKFIDFTYFDLFSLFRKVRKLEDKDNFGFGEYYNPDRLCGWRDCLDCILREECILGKQDYKIFRNLNNEGETIGSSDWIERFKEIERIINEKRDKKELEEKDDSKKELAENEKNHSNNSELDKKDGGNKELDKETKNLGEGSNGENKKVVDKIEENVRKILEGRNGDISMINKTRDIHDNRIKDVLANAQKGIEVKIEPLEIINSKLLDESIYYPREVMHFTRVVIDSESVRNPYVADNSSYVSRVPPIYNEVLKKLRETFVAMRPVIDCETSDCSFKHDPMRGEVVFDFHDNRLGLDEFLNDEKKFKNSINDVNVLKEEGNIQNYHVSEMIDIVLKIGRLSVSIGAGIYVDEIGDMPRLRTGRSEEVYDRIIEQLANDTLKDDFVRNLAFPEIVKFSHCIDWVRDSFIYPSQKYGDKRITTGTDSKVLFRQICVNSDSVMSSCQIRYLKELKRMVVDPDYYVRLMSSITLQRCDIEGIIEQVYVSVPVYVVENILYRDYFLCLFPSESIYLDSYKFMFHYNSGYRHLVMSVLHKSILSGLESMCSYSSVHQSRNAFSLNTNLGPNSSQYVDTISRLSDGSSLERLAWSMICELMAPYTDFGI